MERLFLLTFMILSLVSGMSLAQQETEYAGVAVIVAPIQIDTREYDGALVYEPPLWLSHFQVVAEQLPEFTLELIPHLHYVEHCVYGHAFHVWRFQGSITATLTNAATGEVLSSQMFEGAVPPACPSEVRVTQLGDIVTWPPDEALIAWLESTIGSNHGQSLMPLIDAQVIQIEPLGDLVGAQRPPQVVAFSPDSRYLAAGGESFDPNVYLWDTTSGSLVNTFVLDESNSTEVGAVTFSEDGRLLAAASGVFGNVLRVWDIASGQLMLEIRELYFPSGGLTFNPDATSLAVATTSSEVALVNLVDGQILFTFAADYVHTLAFDPQGHFLFSVGRCGEQTCVQTWDVVSGGNLARFDVGAGFTLAAFTPNRELLVVGSESERMGRVEVWQVAAGQLFAALPDQNGSVIGLGFNLDGTYLAVFADDMDNSTPQELTLWRLLTSENKIFLLPGGGGQMSISPDFTLVATERWYSDLVLWRAAISAEAH